MDENPYQSPREHGYVTPEYLAWWPWLMDRLTLWGCGFAVLVALWTGGMIVVGIAWLFGYRLL